MDFRVLDRGQSEYIPLSDENRRKRYSRLTTSPSLMAYRVVRVIADGDFGKAFAIVITMRAFLMVVHFIKKYTFHFYVNIRQKRRV